MTTQEAPAQQQAQQWNRLFFDEWVAREGLDLIRGYKVDNVYTVPLKPWARTGGSAVQIQLDGTGELNSSYVQEIAPGKQLNPIRHVYEELIYVLAGRGSTSVWYDEKRKNTFEWGPGSLFAIPLNAWCQHFNGSGTEPARYLAMTTAPIMMNLIRNEDFIFNNDARFPEVYGGQEDYFSSNIEWRTFTGWEEPIELAYSNFFADINAVQFNDMNRGVNVRGSLFELRNGIVAAHTAVFPSGTWSKLHRHGPGAHVLWLTGSGYSLMFPDGGEWVKAPWGPGTMIVPPSWWWHQHCVTSQQDGQHLAFKLGSKRYHIHRLSAGSLRSTKSGGSQMNYEDMEPEMFARVKSMFEEECVRNGTPVRMDIVYEG